MILSIGKTKSEHSAVAAVAVISTHKHPTSIQEKLESTRNSGAWSVYRSRVGGAGICGVMRLVLAVSFKTFLLNGSHHVLPSGDVEFGARTRLISHLLRNHVPHTRI